MSVEQDQILERIEQEDGRAVLKFLGHRCGILDTSENVAERQGRYVRLSPKGQAELEWNNK